MSIKGKKISNDTNGLDMETRGEGYKRPLSGVMTGSRPKSAYTQAGFDMRRTTGRAKNSLFDKKAQTQADYDPKFNLVQKKLTTGFAKMDKKTDRTKNPPGRPTEYSNLVNLKNDYSGSIDANQVGQGFNKLGHLSQKIISPNFNLVKSRDLGFYRETEAILNVLRDNEKYVSSNRS